MEAEFYQTENYINPSPIQARAIPLLLAGKDLLGIAQTGTGKTAALALRILDELLCLEPTDGARPIRALVLTPTRELAAQVAESFRSYSPGEAVRCAVVFGGVGKRPQVNELRRGVEILVATPGRLLDLMEDDGTVLGSIGVVMGRGRATVWRFGDATGQNVDLTQGRRFVP